MKRSRGASEINQEPHEPSKDVFRLALALYAKQGEYQLEAFDRAVVARFGPLPPFSRLVRDHERRVRALQYLCRKHHVEVPKNRTAGPECPPTWEEVLPAELSLLKGNLSVYENLLALPVHDPTVHRVLQALRNETRSTHLPLVLAEMAKLRRKPR